MLHIHYLVWELIYQNLVIAVLSNYNLNNIPLKTKFSLITQYLLLQNTIKI
jgi:hypothetical protein